MAKSNVTIVDMNNEAMAADVKIVLLNHVYSGSLPLSKLLNGDLPSMGGVTNKIILSPSSRLKKNLI